MVKYYYLRGDKRFVREYDTMNALIQDMAHETVNYMADEMADTYAIIDARGQRLVYADVADLVTAAAKQLADEQRARPAPEVEYEEFDGFQWEA